MIGVVNIAVPGSEPGWQTVKVLSAAIRILSTGKVFFLDPPARHPAIISYAGTYLHRTPAEHEVERGFLLTNGDFVSRRTAKVIAGFQGQLLETAADFPELFTEELW